MRHSLTAAFVWLLPAAAFADADAILADAAKACAEQDNGVFASEGAVRQIDMTGDGTEDTLVDEALFTCTTAASLYAGSGGSMIHVFVNGAQSSFLVQGYETVRWGDNLIVLLALGGTDCNTINANPCFEALTWVEDRFVSVRPPME
ncbi:MAG: hypothetical protein IOD05_13365 [Rhodobacter sp.]|nr:hypothetical protein [Rhodobacter sp.]MCA3493052.1 hypothetical protein [Rhodobacter sp.]MCA3499247.1 hypothetical protein [Rhodobacter sp.]MCA3504209.1 hypothetical protein [Rhodobacter sp.]MCA3515807.1 hypothetical protein [Rhodobacter sp.]